MKNITGTHTTTIENSINLSKEILAYINLFHPNDYKENPQKLKAIYKQIQQIISIIEKNDKILAKEKTKLETLLNDKPLTKTFDGIINNVEDMNDSIPSFILCSVLQTLHEQKLTKERNRFKTFLTNYEKQETTEEFVLIKQQHISKFKTFLEKINYETMDEK